MVLSTLFDLVFLWISGFFKTDSSNVGHVLWPQWYEVLFGKGEQSTMTHPYLVAVNQITHFLFRQRISREHTGAYYMSFNVYIVMFLHICCRLCNCCFIYALYCKLVTNCKKRSSFFPLWRSISSDWGILPTPFLAIYNAPGLIKIKAYRCICLI